MNEAPEGAPDEPEGGPKWACEYCTFENFPAAGRCTLCRVERKRAPPRRIDDLEGTTLIQEPDDRGGPGPPALPEFGGTSAKWTCGQCTYLNWPKAKKCICCEAPAPPPAALSPRSPPPPPQQEEASTSSGGAGVVYSSQSFDSRLVAKKLKKWTCLYCTYENWPKTILCVMCRCNKSGKTDSTESESLGNNQRQSPTGGQMEDEAVSGLKSPKSSSSSSENVAAAACATTLVRQLKLLKQQRPRHTDFLFLTALRSVAASSCDADPVEAFLAAGGDPTRPMTTAEAHLLRQELPDREFRAGVSLIHLALFYEREDLLPLLLASTDPQVAPLGGGSAYAGGKTENPQAPCSSGASERRKWLQQAVPAGVRRDIKHVPCHVSPDTASEIRQQVAQALRQRKGEFPSFYFTRMSTFALPARIFELSPLVQRKLFDELLDRPVQKELEQDYGVINWSLELTERLGSKLYALWNRTAGDCLLDSVLQATWGVFDSENSLRQALSDSLRDAEHVFYPRWREHERQVFRALPLPTPFAPSERQVADDWHTILRLASRPGSALEQAHVFALAHIVRRPIIVYGARVVRGLHGDDLEYSRFEGVYLPLLWETTWCNRSPICLGYSQHHFVALIPVEQRLRSANQRQYAIVPIQDADGKLLPVHFLSQNEVGHEQAILRTWLDVVLTGDGLWCCRIRLHRPAVLVEQMIDDWVDFYGHTDRSPFAVSSMEMCCVAPKKKLIAVEKSAQIVECENAVSEEKKRDDVDEV